MRSPFIQFGLETEYGIARDGADDLDVVNESIALVRSLSEPGLRLRWDYSGETPHRDMRGFEVAALRQDTDEMDYAVTDSQRGLSSTEIKSDWVLANGARFYNDHAHPEYCTPECSTLEELVVQDRAGERVLMSCAARLSEQRGQTVRIYKNNTDFLGHSYGCHENYLLPRSLPWGTLAEGIQAFLVTRQLIAGSGKFGEEAEDRFLGPGFQLSQRSDFFSELQSVDTMQRRPLINTRDEPHADARQFRRFHVILGDANMSTFSTRLKVGTTALVLEALVCDPRRVHPQLAEPIRTLHAVSRDRTFRWPVRLASGHETTAVEVQWAYLKAVREVCDLTSPARGDLVNAWETVLSDLSVDFRRCRDRLDWAAKYCLIDEFRAEQGLGPDDPWLRSLDLEYHRVDPVQGLYYGMERAGMMRDVVAEDAVRAAVQHPPRTTRAYVRGRCIEKFGAAIVAVQWDRLIFRDGTGQWALSLHDLFVPEQIVRYARMVDEARSSDELHALVRQRKTESSYA